MPPLVSVCLPVFNGAHYLAAAIESVLAQTNGDFELIISDDGSSDGSMRIIEHYAGLDKRIKHSCNEKPAGLFANYNVCLKEAQGRFIKPFAQDDVLHPTMLEKGCSILQSWSNVALMSVARTFLGEDGERVSWDEGDMSPNTVLGRGGFFKAKDIMAACLDPLTNFIGEPCAVMYRAEHAGTGFDEQLHHMGDLEYWVRILREGDYYFLDEPLAQYRRHGDSASLSNWRELKMAPDIIGVSYAFADLIEQSGMSRQEFVQRNLWGLAGVTADLYARNEIALPHSAGGTAATRRVEAWQEALLHALLLTGHGLESLVANEQVKIQQNEQAIVHAEQELRRLLKSFSWRCTRLLRELRAGRLSNDSFLLEELGEQRSDAAQLSRQETYLRYLKKKTAKIIQSRSWALTAPLRAVSSLFGECQDGHVQDLATSYKNITKTEFDRIPESRTVFRTDQAIIAPSGATELVDESFEHQLSIGAVFRNEAHYLAQWIEFHLLLGVEKFYLFNNLSTDDYMSVLSPYLTRGIVDLTEWPIQVSCEEEINAMQCAAYEKIVASAAGSKWLALLDIDEYMYPVEADSLLDVLAEYEEFGGLSVSWRCFGTGGVENIKNDQLLIEALTRRAENDHPRNLYVKTVSINKRIAKCYSPHFVRYVDQYLQVNEDRVPFRGVAAPYATGKKIVINHYWTGDESHFITRKLPRLKAYKSTFTDLQIQSWLTEFNAVEDRQILRFADQLRARVLPNCRYAESRI